MSRGMFTIWDIDSNESCIHWQLCKQAIFCIFDCVTVLLSSLSSSNRVCAVLNYLKNIIFAVLLDVLIMKLSFWSGGETYKRILHISDEGWTNICRWHYVRQCRLPCQCYSSSHKVDTVLTASQFHWKPCHVSIFCCLWIVFHCAVFLTLRANCNAAEVFMMMPWWRSDHCSLVLKTVRWM